MSTQPSSPGSPRRLWETPTWLLNQVASHGSRLVGQKLGRRGLRTHYAVLAGLDEFGPTSQADLVRRIGVDRSDLVAVLNSLEADGLAERSKGPVDRRANTVRITRAGLTTLQHLGNEIDAAQDQLLESLTSAERAQLTSLLQQILPAHED